jgi:hypothetical protein
MDWPNIQLRQLRRALFALVLLLVAAAAPALHAADAVFAEIDSIVAELSRITGLQPKAKVPYAMMNREELRKFLDARIAEVVKPEEIRIEEITLKKFGLVPQDFDLRSTTIDLLTEQAAAFYDYRKKKLFILESASHIQKQTALVHELAHALADQHFNLQKFIEGGSKSDDSAAARHAVMEGQASWLMGEYTARRMGQSLKENKRLLELMTTADPGGGQYPVFDQAPLYIRETLMFPYTRGMAFQHAVYERSGQRAFSEVFRDPPVSTQQILHPDMYFSRVAPLKPAVPQGPKGRDWRELASGSVGELDHSILLRQYAGDSEASALAPQWRGGSYKILENRKDASTVLLYASEWATPEAASSFFRYYRRVLQGKWQKFRILEESESRVLGEGDDGFFELLLAGSRVSSAEGLKSLSDYRSNGAVSR